MKPGYENRSSKRIPVEVPVYIGEEQAISRNVSWSGIYFLTEQFFEQGCELTFALDLAYALPGQRIKLGCQGEVIRIEKQGLKYGIAARINNFQYQH